MPNPNPKAAREAKATRKREALLPILTNLRDAVETAHELLQSEEESTKLKAVHAVSQAAVSYARVYEVGEIENRLAEIENRLGIAS